MSLVVALKVREGIVMATDSRLTLNSTTNQSNLQVINTSVAQTDTTRKLFLTPGNVGIGTYGQADIGGVPLAGFIDSFVATLSGNLTPAQVANAILSYFRNMQTPPNAFFQVTGYDHTKNPIVSEVWTVDIANNSAIQVIPNQQGMSWGGETEIASRLILNVAIPGTNNTWIPLGVPNVLYDFFTLQDAIDFVVYVIRTTIDTMRFQARPKTVGGPIDVLVIQPSGSQWISKKQLHMS